MIQMYIMIPMGEILELKIKWFILANFTVKYAASSFIVNQNRIFKIMITLDYL